MFCLYFLHYLFNIEVNQLEDPRLQWRDEQEAMLKDYLQHAHETLDVSTKLLWGSRVQLTIYNYISPILALYTCYTLNYFI